MSCASRLDARLHRWIDDTAQANRLNDERNVLDQDTTSVDPSPSRKYARRKRHKTKPDKYEYKGVLRDGRQPRSDKKRHGHGSRVYKNASMVVNQDFRAPNVESERLTLERSTNKRGLLSKGRSSVLTEYRDLPDLTFSKMTFLSQCKTQNDDSALFDTVMKPKQDMKSCSVKEATDFFAAHDNSLSDQCQGVETNNSTKDGIDCRKISSSMKQRLDICKEDNLLPRCKVRCEKGSTPLAGDSLQPRCQKAMLADESSSISWSTSPPRSPVNSMKKIVVLPLLANPRVSDNLSILPASESPLMEDYTRRALIGSEPGFWRRLLRLRDNDSICSLEDLRRLVGENESTTKHSSEKSKCKNHSVSPRCRNKDQSLQRDTDVFETHERQLLESSTPQELQPFLKSTAIRECLDSTPSIYLENMNREDRNPNISRFGARHSLTPENIEQALWKRPEHQTEANCPLDYAQI